ncbi:MAG: hypothetical protein ACI9SY_000251 [Candidatus Paceibacteria bacterium]|jgi:hypothetical protein
METKNVSPQKKGSILNTFAVAGFVAIVLLLAWLSIQLVQLFPNALSSLASLAEGVDQTSETMSENDAMEPIVVTSNTSLMKTGEALNIDWQQANVRGSYVFAYDCIDGVAVNQIEGDVERQLECNTNYNVGDVTALTVAIESEKNRYTDVTYSIGFLATNDTQPQAMGSDTITIINEEVNGFAFNTDAGELTADAVVAEAETPVNPVPDTETPNAVTPTPPTPAEPVFVQEFVYEIPTSDLNGITDLLASYIAVGEIRSNRFIPGTVDSDEGGAIQFSVKNIGTKTSDDWTFELSLPNGGTYNSPTQTPLKPNERAVLTIGFAAGSDNTHTFAVAVDESTDRNSRNNSFEQRVTFAN